MNKQQIITDFVNATTHKTEKEQITFDAVRIHLETMVLIGDVMKQKGIKRNELARLIGLNKSYVTKLFKADELLNLKTLAKIQKALDINFTITVAKRTPR